jgi:hypothetical protein
MPKQFYFCIFFKIKSVTKAAFKTILAFIHNFMHFILRLNTKIGPI